MCLRLTVCDDGSHGRATRIRDMAALTLRPTLTEVSRVLTLAMAQLSTAFRVAPSRARVALSPWLGRSEFARQRRLRYAGFAP